MVLDCVVKPLSVIDQNTFHLPDEFAVADVVEKSLNVDVHSVVEMLYLHQSAALRNGVFCAAIGAKAGKNMTEHDLIEDNDD